MYIYALEITKVYDGDTVNGVVDLGFNIKMAIKIRLANIDTPELRTKDPDEKIRGYAARDFLREFLDKFGAGLQVRTTKKGKYGRWIGELLLLADDFEYDELLQNYDITDGYYVINDILVVEGHAEYRKY